MGRRGRLLLFLPIPGAVGLGLGLLLIPGALLSAPGHRGDDPDVARSTLRPAGRSPGVELCEHCGSPAIYLWKHPRRAYFVRACTRDHAIATVAREAWWIKLVTGYRRAEDE